VRRESDGAVLQQEASNCLQPVILDVSDAEGVAAAIGKIAAVAGGAGLAGLVNNAGVSFAGPLEFLPVEDLRQQLEVNVIGQLTVTQACLPLLRVGRGRILMMSSVSGLIASPFLGPYTASKFALEALSDALRVELRPWGISVILVEPGVIATPIWEKSLTVADERIARMPEEARIYYGEAIERVRSFARHSENNGLPAEAVSRVVAEALSASRPRARYLVGPPAIQLVRLLRLVPTPLRDWLVARRLGWGKNNFKTY